MIVSKKIINMQHVIDYLKANDNYIDNNLKLELKNENGINTLIFDDKNTYDSLVFSYQNIFTNLLPNFESNIIRSVKYLNDIIKSVKQSNNNNDAVNINVDMLLNVKIADINELQIYNLYVFTDTITILSDKEDSKYIYGNIVSDLIILQTLPSYKNDVILNHKGSMLANIPEYNNQVISFFYLKRRST